MPSPSLAPRRHRRDAVGRSAGRTFGRTAAVAATAIAAALLSGPSAARAETLQPVMFVGNNWDGTATVIRAGGDYGQLGRVNVIPDKVQRMKEIDADLIRKVYFLGIRETVGEGHDQFVDDLYSTPDGRSLVASRPSFADVVSIDLTTGALKWRFPVSGYRSDHMAISPDGTQVAVSASTANTVHILDIQTGRQIASFATGDKPHENVYTNGGRFLWNMAIGDVNTAFDDPLLDFTKGDRKITVYDTLNKKVAKVIDMRPRLDAAGRKDLSDAVRPAAFTPDGSKLYFQVSFFGGVIEYDVATDRITRVKTLPKNPATSTDRTTWVNDSRHHGLSMSPDGTKLCVAGTMDNYATVVNRSTLQEGPLIPAAKPYWATVSVDGTSCVISESDADQVTVISFATGQKVLSVPVGNHPQRVRQAQVPVGWTSPPLA